MKRLRTPLLFAALWVGCSHDRAGRTVEGDDAAREASATLDEAERQTRALDVDKAASLLNDARQLLRDPSLKANPQQPVLLERFNDDQAALEQARSARSARDLELQVNAQEQNLERARTRLSAAMDDLNRPELTRPQLKALAAAIEGVKAELSRGKPLEAPSPTYKGKTRLAAEQLENAAQVMALGEKRLAFLEGPLPLLAQGGALFDKAKQEPDLDKRKSLAAEARFAFQSCHDTAEKRLKETPDLAKFPVLVAGARSQPSALVTACAQGITRVDDLLSPPAPAAKAPAAKSAPSSKKPHRKKK